MAWGCVGRRGECCEVEQVVAAQRNCFTLWSTPFVGASFEANSPTMGGGYPITKRDIGLYARVRDCLFSAWACINSQSNVKEQMVAKLFIIESLGNGRLLQQVVECATLKLTMGCLDAD